MCQFGVGSCALSQNEGLCFSVIVPLHHIVSFGVGSHALSQTDGLCFSVLVLLPSVVSFFFL